MKTVTQYQEEMKALLDQANAFDVQATAEGRDLSQEELKTQQEILDTVEEYGQIVATLKRKERVADALKQPESGYTIPKDAKIEPVSRKQDRFKSFGEQMAAVIQAGRPGGKVDPRLLNATGLSEGVSSDGGFLVQQDFANDLLQDVFETGKLVSQCRKQTISGNANGIKINGVDETSRASTRYGGVLAYWKDEAGTKTASKPKFRQIDLSLKKLIGLCYATDELLEDAAALESFLGQAFRDEFNFRLDDAIINGTGAGMPLGILNAGCLVTVSKETGQAASTIVTENIVKMYARRFAGQTGNYMWLYNQDIEPQLFTMSLNVGTGGMPVYMPPGGLNDAPYGRLMGLPAMAIEQCQTLGTAGDIILANLKDGYIMAEKGGIKQDMSIHVQFIYDESVFRFVLRVDGQPVRASALTPFKGSNDLSHFIALEGR
jgi:HK97 family phage major capsid protein